MQKQMIAGHIYNLINHHCSQPTFNDAHWVNLAAEGHGCPALDFAYPALSPLASSPLLLLSDYALLESFPVNFFTQSHLPWFKLCWQKLTTALPFGPILYSFPPKCMQDPHCSLVHSIFQTLHTRHICNPCNWKTGGKYTNSSPTKKKKEQPTSQCFSAKSLIKNKMYLSLKIN